MRGFFVSVTGEIISMARSEVITLSPAGAEIPELTRCEALTFSIPVEPGPINRFEFDVSLREACDKLSDRGIQNFIHYAWDDNNSFNITTVELPEHRAFLTPTINYLTNSIELREGDLCDMT